MPPASPENRTSGRCSPPMEKADEVRNHQTHKADNARHGHAGPGQQAGADQQNGADARCVHPQLPGLGFAQGHDVQLAKVDDDDAHAEQAIGKEQKQMGEAASLEAAHDPKYNAGSRVLVQGFDQGDTGGQRGGPTNDTRASTSVSRRMPPAPAGKGKNSGQSQQSATQTSHRQNAQRQPEQ